MTPESSVAALHQMLISWERSVAENPEGSPVSERAIKHLSDRVEVRLARGGTALDCLLLELGPMFETTDEELFL